MKFKLRRKPKKSEVKHLTMFGATFVEGFLALPEEYAHVARQYVEDGLIAA